jgi:hypothetical protein
MSSDRGNYERFLRKFFAQGNGSRTVRVAAERLQLRDLPARRVDAGHRRWMRVTQASTIRVRTNTFMVPCRLIGALAEVHLLADFIEVRRGEELVVTLPRIYGQHQQLINLQHLIGWLASDPGAFAAFPHRVALFPTCRFRRAYGILRFQFPHNAGEKYLRILSLAANGSTDSVDAALGQLLEWRVPILPSFVEEHLRHLERMRRASEAAIPTSDRSTDITGGFQV